MRLAVAVVGKPRTPGLAEAIRTYETRAARYWPLDVYEVREESAKSLTADLVRQREGERLLSNVDPKTHVVACDVRGRSMSSEEFATWLQRKREGARDIALLVGGALGLSDSVRERADERLALAPWTLPHELARLVLAEQIYRAGTLVRREPYHK